MTTQTTTQNLLKRYLATAMEIRQMEEYCEKIRSAVYEPGRARHSDMPRAKQWNRQEDMIVALVDLEQVMAKKLVELYRLQTTIETHIDEIEEPILRVIMRKRYIEGKAWCTVADEVGYSEYHVRRLTKELRA